MAVTADKVVVELELKDGQYLAKVRAAANTFSAAQKKSADAAQDAERRIRASSDGVASSLRSAAAALAAGVSAAAITKMADSYTSMQNRLKVTGLETAALADQFDNLSKVADSARSPLDAVVGTYSRLRLATEGMGFTNAEVTRTTEILSKALKASGATAQETGAALLQFGQGVGSGALQGDELRSIRENAPLIARAIADEFNVTIGGLKKLGEEGKLTSERVVKAVLASGQAIDAQWGKTDATVGDALTNIQNRLVRYIGETDKSLDATKRFVAGVNVLADNIETIVPALAILSVGLGVGLVTRSIQAQIALNGVTGSLGKMRAAALSAFGGPVGIAITGVAIAIAGLASEGIDAAADLETLRKSVESADDAIYKMNPAAKTGASLVKGVGAESEVAEVKVRSFAGAVGEAAQKLYDLAKARQADALSALEAERTKVSVGVSDAQMRLPENQRNLQNRQFTSLKDTWDTFARRGNQVIQDLWTGGEFTARNRAAVADGRSALGRLDAAIAATGANLERFATDVDDAVTSVSSGGGQTPARAAVRAAADQADTEAQDLARALSEIQDSLLTDAERAAKQLAEQAAIIARAVGDGTKPGLITAEQGARLNAGLAGQDLQGFAPQDLQPLGNEGEEIGKMIAEGAAAQVESWRGVARDFVDVLASDNIWEAAGHKFRDAAFNQLEDMLTNVFAALSKGGDGSGNWLATLASAAFGGNRASGGNVRAGMSYNVGEGGTERFVAPSNGYIIPNMKNAGASPGMSGMVRIQIGEGEMFSARVTEIAGPLSVQAATTGVAYSQDQAVNAQKRRGQSFV